MAYAPRFLRSRQRLDQKITIQRRSGAKNAMNESTNEWADVFETRAQAYPSMGFERTVGDQNKAITPWTFEVRDEARTRGILPSDRVWWNNQAFNIVAPIEQPERGRNLRIMTTAER